ncbi:gamma-2-syntrophin [Vidua macroura]|uniref:gamma-2-syntrophin n=1 Tax=Vidua macroura TaxID=187451 RepID=UPI0023A796EA|nr:gamma-2-syntrophin [Vidua macroura]
MVTSAIVRKSKIQYCSSSDDLDVGTEKAFRKFADACAGEAGAPLLGCLLPPRCQAQQRSCPGPYCALLTYESIRARSATFAVLCNMSSSVWAGPLGQPQVSSSEAVLVLVMVLFPRYRASPMGRKAEAAAGGLHVGFRVEGVLNYSSEIWDKSIPFLLHIFRDASSDLFTESLTLTTKTGIALLYDEVSENAYDIRLKLTKEVLTIQKQDVVCVSGSDHSANHRTVTLRRQPVGGLGLSIKGGAEHKVPVVISKIFKNQAAEQTGMLFIGDAIIQVNGINVESATHEEVVHLLRNAGDEVTITVQYLREAPSFLKLPLGSPGPSSDHSSGTSSPLFDSGLHLNGNSTNTAPSSPSSPIANEPKYEKRWLDTLSVPLSMARISRYKTGTDKLRSNAFEVLALDGVSTGILQFYTAQESADWLRAMSTNISDLTLQNMKMANKCCSPSDQVIHMGWVNERLEGTDSSQLYKFKFLALKGSSFYIFSTPPVSTLDWVRAEKIYNLCEVLFKIHKLWLADDCWLQANLYLGIHQDFDLEDQRPYCFSVMVGHGKSHYFNVELGNELAVWEKSFQRAIFLEVQRTGSKTYMCSWQGDTLCFTVDFALGFTCFDSKTKNVLWRFKFSQLKGSSDDGKTRVKLLFQNLDTKQIETKELEFQDLTAVLHCIHSFIAAKVASVDPIFIDSQSIARKYMYSN